MHVSLYMKQIFLVITLIITVLSCSETVVAPQSTLLSLSGSEEAKIDCRDLFKPAEIVPLRETLDFHIKSVKKVECYNDEYYVLCSSSKDALVVFDQSGAKKREIGHWGNGHGEHGQINDFCIDKKNQRVIMLCANSCVITYSLLGEYLSAKRISDSVLGNIACINGNVMCTTNHQTFTEGDNAYLFYVFDDNFNLVAKHTNVLPDYMGMFSLQTVPLKVFNNRFIYSDFYTHHIYILDNMGGVLQTYCYGDCELMPSKLFREYNLFTENQFKYGFILDNIILNDTILSIYKTDSQIRLSIDNREGHKIKDYPIKGAIPKFYTSDGEHVLSVMTVEDLEKMENADYKKNPDAFFFIIKYNINLM